MEDSKNGAPRGKYAAYADSQRAKIGKYAAENGTTLACRYFSELLKRNVPLDGWNVGKHVKCLNYQQTLGAVLKPFKTKLYGQLVEL